MKFISLEKLSNAINGVYNKVKTNFATKDELEAELDKKSDEGHTHNYLPLTGGTMTGNITMSGGKGLYGTISSDLVNSDGETVAAGTTSSLLMYTSTHNFHIGALINEKKLTTGTTYMYGGVNLQLRTNNGGIQLNPFGTNTWVFNKDKSTTNKPINFNMVTGSYLAGNKGTAMLNSTATAGSYVTIAKTNSTNGYFTLNGYKEGAFLSYTNADTVAAETNQVTKTVKLLDENGNSAFPGNVTFNGDISSTGGIQVNNVLVNAWTDTGSGYADIWYHGTDKQLYIDEIDSIKIGGNLLVDGTNTYVDFIEASGPALFNDDLEVKGTTYTEDIISSSFQTDSVYDGTTAYNATPQGLSYFRTDNTGNGSASTYSATLTVKSVADRQFQICANNTGSTLAFRSGHTNNTDGTGTGWSAWKQVYHEDNPQVNITGNAGTATKLATARTINDVSFNGTSNIAVPLKTFRSSVSSSNARPYHHILSTGVCNSAYTDKSITVLATGNYNSGRFGIFKATFRTDGDKSGTYELQWFVRHGFAKDSIVCNLVSTAGSACLDVFYKSHATYAGMTWIVLSEGSRSVAYDNNTWTKYNTAIGTEGTGTNVYTEAEMKALRSYTGTLMQGVDKGNLPMDGSSPMTGSLNTTGVYFNMERPWQFVSDGSAANNRLLLQCLSNDKTFAVSNTEASRMCRFISNSSNMNVEIDGYIKPEVTYINGKKVTVATSAPSSPATGDIWIDI